MSSFLARRFDPEERAGLRLTLLATGALALVVLLLPLTVLVRDSYGPLTRLDVRTDAAAHTAVIAHLWLLDLARVFSFIGSPVVVEVASAGLVLLLLRRRRRRTALYLTTCIVGAYVLSTIGKITVDRVRPSFPDPVSVARGSSFPSGHATGSSAFYLALVFVLLSLGARRWRRLVFAAALLIPLGVACSRVLLGVHYPSDVVAGLALGWGWVAACTAVFTAWQADSGRAVEPTKEGIEPEPVE